MQMKKAFTAEILSIGDEILIGQILNTNSQWLASKLSEENFVVNRMVTVPDKHDLILEAVDKAINDTDLVIITGGLGPTKDDLTKDVLATYFNSSWRWDEDTLQNLEKIFANRGKHLQEINKIQAYVPDNCTTIFNKLGTAPGMLFRKEHKIVISLPGVPFEMIEMMNNVVLPLLRKEFQSAPTLRHHFFTIGVPESLLAERLSSIEDNLPAHFSLAYLPHLNVVRLRLTCNIQNQQNDSLLFQEFSQQFKQTLGNDLLMEEDIPLAAYTALLLHNTQTSFSLAESCTGGLISQHFTQIPGISAIYKGGAVVYSNESKTNILKIPAGLIEQHGAVSEEVAAAMAENCRTVFQSDIAVSVTGIAGPDGGTDDKPVGTVYIGYSSQRSTITKKFLFTRERKHIQESTLYAALAFIIRNIENS